MSGVTNGQAVDAPVTNAAFLAANGPTTGIGAVTLAAAGSGPTVIDVQNAINVLLGGVGGTQTTPATAYGSIPANTIPSGSSHIDALIVLANLFSNTTGHTHDGTQGKGGPIYAVSGISISGSSVLQGSVILVGSGLASMTQLGQVIQINARTPELVEVLASGNSATAGINFDGGGIAGLSYADILNAGFPPGFPTSGHIYLAASGDDHYYLRTASSATRRLDGTLAASGNTALYGDVILIGGTNVTLSQSGQQITITAASGTAVQSIAVSGSTPLTGAVTISASGGAVLAQSGQNITVYAPTGGGSSTSAGVGAFNIAILDVAASAWAPTKTNNQDAESTVGDWAAYADAAGVIPVDMTGGSPNTTITRNTSSPLDGTADFKVTVTTGASRQGEGVSLLVNIPTGYRGKAIRVSCPFATTGTIAQGDFVPYAYDVTNSSLLAPSTVVSGISGSAGTLYATFLTQSTTAQLRIGLHIARTSTGAATINFDDFKVEPDLDQANVPMSDWVAFTPTFTAWGTVATSAFFWRRVGDSMQIQGKFTAGTVTAAEARVSLPSGYTIDSTKIPAIRCVGWTATDFNAASTIATLAESAVTYLTFGLQNSGNNALTKANANSLINSGNIVSLFAEVPISGWSAGGGASPMLSLSDWQSYTLTPGGSTSAPTKGTSTLDEARWRRVGDSMEIVWNYKQTGAGSAGSGKYLLPLPTGYIIDASKQSADAGSGATCAAMVGVLTVDTGPGSRRIGPVNVYNTTNLAAQVDEGTDSLSRWGSDDAPLSNTDLIVSFFARVPIAGWTATSSGSLTAPRSEVTVDSANGRGATSTAVMRFSNIRKNTGAAITYADDANLGGTFTVNEVGVYAISLNSGVNADTIQIGVTVNSTALTSSPNSMTYAQGLRAQGYAAANSSKPWVGWTGNLVPGDIIRAQMSSLTPLTDAETMMTVTKVSN